VRANVSVVRMVKNGYGQPSKSMSATLESRAPGLAMEIVMTRKHLSSATMSNIDKICLIWALYKSTYETLGQRNFVCDKENCKTQFKQEILLESLIQEDTFTIWEEDKPFYNFTYDIEVSLW